MTSIILMQKLLTMKLDKAEFDKIKWQQADVSRRKHKVMKSLQEILEQQSTGKTCRLCLRLADQRIFGGDQDFDVTLHVRSILGIEITEDDGKPQHICKECENIVRRASQLKLTAEATQWRLQQEIDMVSECAPHCSEDDDQHGDCNTLDMEAAREWVCTKCRRTFHTQEEFNEHKKLASCRAQLRCYMCETCGKEFKTMSRLKRHRLIHTGSLPHSCPWCPYRARTRYALAAHARAHAGARPLRCPHAPCAATFANSSNLASHRRKHLPPRFLCQLCQRGFRFKVGLQNHIATQHSNAKPYICDVCGKAFSTRKMILRHELKAHNRPKMRSGVLPSYLRHDDT